jgi:hypothetical protein
LAFVALAIAGLVFLDLVNVSLVAKLVGVVGGGVGRGGVSVAVDGVLGDEVVY